MTVMLVVMMMMMSYTGGEAEKQERIGVDQDVGVTAMVCPR